MKNVTRKLRYVSKIPTLPNIVGLGFRFSGRTPGEVMIILIYISIIVSSYLLSNGVDMTGLPHSR